MSTKPLDTMDITELLDYLDKYPAYKLCKYTQPFKDGKVLEVSYGCSICINSKWTAEEYGSTIELAIQRAIELAEEG